MSKDFFDSNNFDTTNAKITQKIKCLATKCVTDKAINPINVADEKYCLFKNELIIKVVKIKYIIVGKRIPNIIAKSKKVLCASLPCNILSPTNAPAPRPIIGLFQITSNEVSRSLALYPDSSPLLI